MLVVHWSPVKNTRQILKNGIRKSGPGVYCFPMAGNPSSYRYWRHLFRAGRPLEYNGFVFRLTPGDLPASFGHYAGGTTYLTLPELTAAYRARIIHYIANCHIPLGYGDYADDKLTTEELEALVASTFQKLSTADPGLYQRTLADCPFADYQIVLPHSIAPERIIKVIPGGGQSGRQIRNKRRYANEKDDS